VSIQAKLRRRFGYPAGWGHPNQHLQAANILL